MIRWMPGFLLLLTPLALAAETTPPPDLPGWDRVLSLGPYGALLWGALLLGRAVEKLTTLKITIQVELSEADRGLLRRLGQPPSPEKRTWGTHPHEEPSHG